MTETFEKPTEEQPQRKPWKTLGVAALALGTAAAYMKSDRIVEALYPLDLPPVPTAPEPMPVPVREPINVAIAFDASSSMAREFETAKTETRGFIGTTNLFKPGDHLTLCTFVENLFCSKLMAAEKKAEVQAAIEALETEAPRRGMMTHINRSIHAALGQLQRQKNLTLITWTDGDDDQKRDLRKLPADHAPVKILVPLERYRLNALKVKQGLAGGKKAPQDPKVEVVVAEEPGALNKSLTKFVGDLENAATEKVEKEHREKMAKAALQTIQQWNEYFTKFSKVMEERNKTNGGIETVETWASRGLLAVMALLATLTGTLLYLQNRPYLKGYVAYKKREDDEDFTCRQLPGTQKNYPLTIGKKRYVLTPRRHGIQVDSQELQSGISRGQMIAPGANVYWFSKKPTQEQLQELKSRS